MMDVVGLRIPFPMESPANAILKKTIAAPKWDGVEKPKNTATVKIVSTTGQRVINLPNSVTVLV